MRRALKPRPTNSERHITGQGGGGHLVPVEKGERRGRKPGVPNKTTRVLKEAILLAAECMGMPEIKRNAKGEITELKETGEDGLLGYLRFICQTDTKAYVSLLRSILPLQINARVGGEVRHYHSLDDIRDELLKRGVPQHMLPVKMLPPSDAKH